MLERRINIGLKPCAAPAFYVGLSCETLVSLGLLSFIQVIQVLFIIFDDNSLHMLSYYTVVTSQLRG